MIKSMTAFASCSDQGEWGMATWEIKVVNHRYFDCSIKMPDVFRSGLETSIRLQLQQSLIRGRVDGILKFSASTKSNTDFVLNEALIKKIVDALTQVKSYLPMSNIDPMKILTWPDVLQTAEEDLSAAQDAILKLFERALGELAATRQREGAELEQLIKKRLQELSTIVIKVKEKMPQVLINQKQKITKRLEEVVASLDQNRLEQEMVYFAQKIDVAEELDRLDAHVKEVLRVLNGDDMAGKRLDFLMQELNREANTLASKSADADITQAALELKVLIEQMREQVQNVV